MRSSLTAMARAAETKNNNCWQTPLQRTRLPRFQCTANYRSTPNWPHWKYAASRGKLGTESQWTRQLATRNNFHCPYSAAVNPSEVDGYPSGNCLFYCCQRKAVSEDQTRGRCAFSVDDFPHQRREKRKEKETNRGTTSIEDRVLPIMAKADVGRV